MGFLTKGREAQADKYAEQAKQALDEGHGALVLRVEATTGLSDEKLTLAVSAVVGVGWTFHSMNVFQATSGLNKEVALLTFTR